MKPDKVEIKRRRVVNIVEIGDDGLVYIRLDDGKKYLLKGDGCWRCGSTADCFGNMDDSELEVICEFDFFDEVKSLFSEFPSFLRIEMFIASFQSILSCARASCGVCIAVDAAIGAKHGIPADIYAAGASAQFSLSARLLFIVGFSGWM